MHTSTLRFESGLSSGTKTPFRGMVQNITQSYRSILVRYGLILALIVLAIIFQVLTDGLFLSSGNVATLLRQAAITGIVACGVCLIIVTGNIDLSIGSTVGICAITFAYLVAVAGWPTIPALLVTLLVGIVIGAWQGFLVAGVGVPAFIVTLAGLLVFRGAGLVITGGNTISGLPQEVVWLGSGMLNFPTTLVFFSALMLGVIGVQTLAGRVSLQSFTRNIPRLVILIVVIGAAMFYIYTGPGLPVPVAILAVVGAVLALLASRTSFGRRLYAIGGNPQGAKLSGIRIGRNVFLIFCIMGVLYAVAGLVLVARLNGAPPDGAPFLELDAIAAAVIGGTSLMGGVGRVEGAIFGAVLMASVSNGLSLMNVSSFYQMIASGLILVAAVTLDIRGKKNAGIE